MPFTKTVGTLKEVVVILWKPTSRITTGLIQIGIFNFAEFHDITVFVASTPFHWHFHGLHYCITSCLTGNNIDLGMLILFFYLWHEIAEESRLEAYCKPTDCQFQLVLIQYLKIIIAWIHSLNVIDVIWAKFESMTEFDSADEGDASGKSDFLALSLDPLCAEKS